MKRILASSHAQSGYGLIELLIGATIFTTVSAAVIRGTLGDRSILKKTDNKLKAELFASELLEFFHSMGSSQLTNYLSQNPIDASFRQYFLCSHINLLDRASGKIVNRDPMADLPSGLFGSPETNRGANRFYQVFVVNVDTLQIDKSRCQSTASSLGSNERYLVTVGVTWQESQTERIVLSTILPE